MDLDQTIVEEVKKSKIQFRRVYRTNRIPLVESGNIVETNSTKKINPHYFLFFMPEYSEKASRFVQRLQRKLHKDHRVRVEFKTSDSGNVSLDYIEKQNFEKIYQVPYFKLS